MKNNGLRSLCLVEKYVSDAPKYDCTFWKTAPRRHVKDSDNYFLYLRECVLDESTFFFIGSCAPRVIFFDTVTLTNDFDTLFITYDKMIFSCLKLVKVCICCTKTEECISGLNH